MSQALDERAAAGFLRQQRSVTADSTPELVSIISTAELSRRPSRPPDHAENRALIAFAQDNGHFTRRNPAKARGNCIAEIARSA